MPSETIPLALLPALKAGILSRQRRRSATAADPISDVITLRRNNPEAYRERVRRDPEWFQRSVLGSDPYAKQTEMLLSVRDNEQTSTNGANGVGKDWEVGRIVVWWQEAFSPAKAIITAPTGRQIKEIVWREVREAYQNARIPLGGRMLPTAPMWDIGNQSFAFGFSTDKPWNITGFHSPNLLVVISEAHNYSDEAVKQIKRLHPNRLLLSGNPLSESGEFYDSHHERSHLYHGITITAYDSPNVINQNDAIPGLVTQRDIEKAAEDWGVDSPDFKSTIDAEFAGRSDGLIRLALLHAASLPAAYQNGPVRVGIDVAGPGDDETVLTVAEIDEREKPTARIVLQQSWRKDDARGDVIAALEPYHDKIIVANVDEVGLGYFWAKDFREAGIPARGVNVGKQPRKPERFRMLKDELYWGLRERFEDGDIIGLSAKARGQLASLRYDHNARGQMMVESKDQLRARGVPSPDYAESTMLCFAPGSVTLGGGGDDTRRRPDVPGASDPSFANIRRRTF